MTDFDAASDTVTFTPAVGTAVSMETYQLTNDGILINGNARRGLIPQPPLLRGASTEF